MWVGALRFLVRLGLVLQGFEGFEGLAVGLLEAAVEGGEQGAGGGEVVVSGIGEDEPVVPAAQGLVEVVEALGGSGSC